MELSQTYDIQEHTSKKIKRRASFLSWARFFLLLMAIFLFFRFGIGMSVISGNSMSPTLHDGDLVLIKKAFIHPERSDIILVRDPNGYNIIKRVIAIPGESIEIINGMVYINNQPLKESYSAGESLDIPKTTVPDGHYFVIGDNRTPGESLDSRDENIGPIREEHVIGNALLSLFPFNLF